MNESNEKNINKNTEKNTEKNTNKICKFYVKGKCTTENCSFLHQDNICKYYFLEGKCKFHEKCKFSHEFTIIKINKKKKHTKNTENFTPSHEKSHMNIMIGNSNQEFYGKDIKTNDVILVNQFLNQNNSNEFYNKLLDEVKESGLNDKELWKLWHGNTHSIIDDNLEWKKKVPTFQLIIEKIEKYFKFDTKSTRFNFYKDSSDWKPFHHDAAAIKPHIAKKQNMTIALSLGMTRQTAFEFNDNKCVVSIPLEDNSVYAFARDVNINWKHGIPQIHPDQYKNEGRISIILWGWCDQFED